MNPVLEPILTRLRADTTLRWPCRQGDVIAWFRCRGVFAELSTMYKVADTWFMRDGDTVTITNRAEDLPPCFQLHLTEVSGKYIDYPDRHGGPDAPLRGPNIWRVMAADRIVWLGPPRPGQPHVEGLLGLVDCWQCAVVLGESNRPGLDKFMEFGVPPTGHEVTLQDRQRAQRALQAVQEVGEPDVIAMIWLIG